MIHISSLTPSARRKFQEIIKLKEDIVSESLSDKENEYPWYVDTDIDWYIENYKTNYYKAVELGNVVRNYLNHKVDGDKTEYAEAYAQEHLGKGQRTLYRYVKAYQEACAWAIKLEKDIGTNYDFVKVLSLCRKPKEAGTFPSIKPEVKQLIKNIWFHKEFAANNPTIEMLYEKLIQIANINRWDKLPSYQTIVRYIHHLMYDEGLKNAHYLASKGIIEYKNKVMVKASRDTSSLKAMQIVMGDEHTMDCWVSYKLPNGNVIAIKPKLVAWVDVRSRYILGDMLCHNPNSDILKQSLLKMLYQEHGGVPEYLYIDNGKDYTAKTMTGRDRKERSGLGFDDAAKGFYRSIGIKDDHRALPYEPWSKGQIERFFGTVCNQFTKWFTSYTGTLTGSQTADKINKNIKKMLDNGELLTLEEFYQKWSEWLHEVYLQKRHSALKNEEYKTPYSLFINAERYEKAVPPKSYATMLMLKSENVRVYNIGIKKFGFEYRADELCDYINQSVDIKYDPADLTVLYVFDKKGKKICEAYSQELLQIAPKVAQQAVEEHKKRQKRQIRQDRERLVEANIPFEEINDQFVGFDSTVGGIDLMIGKPKRKSKVVSLPTDRTYQQGFKASNRQSAQDNTYINNQANKAMEQLKAMNR